MAVCLPSLSDLRAERTLMEINQELQLQLEKYKQDFRDLTEKFLVSQATAYSLANHLQKYNCKACKDIVESVLGEKLPVEVRRPAEKLAEKPTLDERLRTCEVLIRSQARELTQLLQTLQDGKDDSVLLKQHLKDLLTHNDLNNHQGQDFRESLSEGYRLAERLARKLSPVFPSIRVFSNELDLHIIHHLSCVLLPPLLHIFYSVRSILGTYQHGKFIFQWPIFLSFHTVHGVLKTKILKTVPSVLKGPALVLSLSFFSWLRACLCHPDPSVRHLTQMNCDNSHPPQLEIHRGYLSELNGTHSNNENYHKQVNGQELTFPSGDSKRPQIQRKIENSLCNSFIYSFNSNYLFNNIVYLSFTSFVNLQDVEKKAVFQQSQDECVSVPSTVWEGSACNQPYSDGKFDLPVSLSSNSASMSLSTILMFTLDHHDPSMAGGKLTEMGQTACHQHCSGTLVCSICG
ncbi:hypothetical protein FD755_024341 [Muntiacus reevesi]|uniref:Olduvai domain-containing protein n=1 Tax=Muntiacus reevesi TaxID=9886 RepID=A0A5N3VA91_MUNRE|nr:hypothetical protein FD755_024341 [Muntiacus reevesi]